MPVAAIVTPQQPHSTGEFMYACRVGFFFFFGFGMNQSGSVTPHARR